MKKRFNSFVSMFLVICMVISNIPVYAIAESASKLGTSTSTETNLTTSKQEFNAASSSKVFDYVDRAEFESHKFVGRVLEDEELNSYVFQNEDGSRTAYFFSENVKYVDKDGVVQEKDISLTTTRSGYSTTRNDVTASFSSSPSNGITMGYEKYSVTLTPIFTTRGVTASQKDNSVEYVGLFNSYTTLKYTPLLSGIKEDIVLTKYAGVNEYSFTLTTNGLGVYESSAGFYLAESSKTKAIFYLGDVIAYDANLVPYEGTLTVETVKENQEYILTISVDETFLTDKNTAYPVTIDPTLTIGDSYSGANSIQDAPIFSARPSSNHGTYEYDRVGTPSAEFGVGRTVVRLSGLINSQVYKKSSVLDISSVKFFAKEATGSATQYINLYPLQNTGWTESGVTWNNVGVYYTTSQNYGASMAYAQLTEFNITGLVLAWKTGTYSANAGFIMMSSNESANKCFVSSEHSDTIRRPYVEMEYSTKLSLDCTSVSIAEGNNKNLIANTNSSQAVTWSSSNDAVATVDGTGKVSAHKAGIVNITARTVDDEGVTWEAICKIYVYIPDGVYYFNNAYNNYRIEFFGMNSYGEREPLTAYYSGTGVPTNRYQMFKIQYLGEGLYSIRSMLDNAKGWIRSGTSLISKTIDTAGGSVLDIAQWRIASNANGYYIYSLFGTSRTVTCPARPDDDWNMVLQEYSSTNKNQIWTINKINTAYNGVELRDVIDEIAEGKSFQFTATRYSTYTGDDAQNNLIWTVSNGTGSATINSSSGLLTGVSSGTVVVTATYQYSSNQQCNSSVTVVIQERYLAELVDTYGFSEYEATLIKSLYYKIDILFPNESNLQKAWKCARLLGGMTYTGDDYADSKSKFKWNQVAGNLLGSTSEEDYFVNTLGFTLGQYNTLVSAINLQHGDNSTPDFAHYQISLASRLAYRIDMDGSIIDISNVFAGEDISYLAGWLGDAVLLTNGTTIMGNDDYCADLDAENTYRYILNGYSSVNAIKEYYCTFSEAENRATIFLDYIPYDVVCGKVFHYLIDIDLTIMVNTFREAEDYEMARYYERLLEDEEYHWDQIQELYPDTYNFLKSLEDNLENIGDY